VSEAIEAIANASASAGPRIIPLAGALGLLQIYNTIPDDLPFRIYIGYVVSAGVVICVITFVLRMFFKWPPSPDFSVKKNKTQ